MIVALLALAVSAAPTLPVAEWSGRLVLPAPEARRPDGGVLFVVENAPPAHAALVGRTVPLRYGDDPGLLERAARATVDVALVDEARAGLARGDVHPVRLDGWRRVSPLESLAGARPVDDVRVALSRVRVEDGGLVVAREPLQIVGRETMLATFVAPVEGGRWRVRAWDRARRGFVGAEEIVDVAAARAPTKTAAPLTSLDGVHRTTQNADGFYLHGRRRDDGRFVVEALEPRGLFRLAPDLTVVGLDDGKRWLLERNWHDTEAKKQTSLRVRLAPSKDAPAWRVGDRALVVHLFGGVGGPRGEPAPVPFTVAGHFSFGEARVVEDPFTGDPRFVVETWQVYAHGLQGVVSSRAAYAAYLGSLERGWMYQRPVSDLLVRLPALTDDYALPTGALNPLDAFGGELEVMTARYRTGDGTGGSFVTPSTSCVQDSAQALFVSLSRFRGEIAPRAQALDAPTRARLDRVAALLDAVERRLLPLGFLRADWRESARLAVVARDAPASTGAQAARAVVTAPTMLPRAAHDALGVLALEHGADVFVLRTNQIGGVIEGVVPQAPQSILRR